MPTILFERTGYVAEVPEGGRVLDVCDEHPRAGIPFSCRGANCGTCRVEVVEGESFCAEPSADEKELLVRVGGPRLRLGCQLVVKPGSGWIRLRATL